jgi:hypothetical protein
MNKNTKVNDKLMSAVNEMFIYVGIPALRTDARGRVIRLPARYRDT